jgi:hypothetical protein
MDNIHLICLNKLRFRLVTRYTIMCHSYGRLRNVSNHWATS